MGPAEFIFLVSVMALTTAGILDAAMTPGVCFERAGKHKVRWILAQLLLPYIGAVVYFSAIRADVRFFCRPSSSDWDEPGAQDPPSLPETDEKDGDLGVGTE
jgi:hypothetical protein